MSIHSPSVVAVDVGYGNTKMVCGHSIDKAGRSKWMELVFPSILSPVVVNEEASGFGNNPDRVLIEHGGKSYYVGPKATSGFVPRIIEPNYIETQTHEVLLIAALHFAMRESNKVISEVEKLVLGLPVSGFAAQRERLIEIGQKTRTVPVPKHLQGQAGGATVEVKVKGCVAAPQPFGAMRCAAQGLPTTDPVFQSGVLSMVVDPGYRTLDWFVAEGLTPELKLSGSYDGGVSSILREISQQIGYDHGTGSLEFDQVERGLKSGQINLGYKIIDMAKYQPMVQELASQEIGTFLTRMGSRRDSLARVFLAGGGATYYEQALRERLPGCAVDVLPNPVMSNARGYWLLGCDALDD